MPPSPTVTLLTAGHSPGATDDELSASFTPSANKLILVCYAFYRNSSNPAAGGISGFGLTWDVMGDFVFSPAASGYVRCGRMKIYRALPTTAPGSGQITFTHGSSSIDRTWIIIEIDQIAPGANGANAIVQIGNNMGESASPLRNLNAFSDINNYTFGFAAGIVQSGSTLTTINPGSGFTEVTEQSRNNVLRTQFEWKANNDTGVDAVMNTSAPWGMLGLEIKSDRQRINKSTILKHDISNIPTNSVAPVISGIPKQGETLTVTNSGTWTPTPTSYDVQWFYDMLVTEFVMLAGSSSNRYEDLSDVANYVVASGDRLLYDVSWHFQAGNTKIGMDLGATSGLWLRDTGATDQNGLPTHPNTDLSAYTNPTNQEFYSRDIPLSSMAGLTIDKFVIACVNSGEGGTWKAAFRNVKIVNSSGVTQRSIYEGFSSLNGNAPNGDKPAHAVVLSTNAPNVPDFSNGWLVEIDEGVAANTGSYVLGSNVVKPALPGHRMRAMVAGENASGLGNRIPSNVIGPITVKVADAIALKYYLRTSVSNEIDFVYDIFALIRVTDDLTLRYGISERILDERVLDYGVLQTVANARALDFDILQKAENERILNYDIGSKLLKELKLDYGLGATVAAQRGFQYDVVGRISDILTLVYGMEGKVGDALRIQYDLLQPVDNSLGLLYGIRASAFAQLELDYYVLNPSSLSRILSYEILQKTSDALEIDYDILNAVAQTRALQYDIGVRVSDQLGLLYDVFARAIKIRRLRYDILVLGRVAQNSQLAYDVLQAIQATKSLSYDVLARTSAPVGLRWHDLERTLAALGLKYDLLELTGAQKILLYDIIGRAAMQLELDYDVFERIFDALNISYYMGDRFAGDETGAYQSIPTQAFLRRAGIPTAILSTADVPNDGEIVDSGPGPG